MTFFKCIENIRIPKYALIQSFDKTALSGYSEASESAYDAAVYTHYTMTNRAAKLH